MRLKQNFVMIIILALLLGSICLGATTIKEEDNEPVIPDDEPVVDVIPDDFCKEVNNADGIPTEVIDVIKNYMNDYFLSIYTLEQQDTSKYFISDVDAKISNAAIKLLVESRKLYDFDFTMSDAHYVLNVTNHSNDGDNYKIGFLEDDSFSFKFLNGITSESYDIENSITIKKENDEYRIAEFEKVQGYYMMFSDNRDENIDEIYDFYFNRLKNVIEDENYKKDLAAQNPYVEKKTYSVKYNREAASNYVEMYCHNRNDAYYDFSDEGGNCQNLSSQALVAGGMVMDESGDCEWYYYDHLDYVPSWVHVESFNDYCKDNDGSGLVCVVNENIYYAEPGDIIQVGISSISHTTMVSKVVDGHILLNSNSIDMKDFPLEAYTYPVRKLIKILGSNS